MNALSKFASILLLLWIAIWRLVGMVIAPIIVGLIIGYGEACGKIQKSLEELK